ncbi:hypothetical protein [Actibacterium ureilyticum]|uniref:hypothetical protein n=1 Tax=Actibacterium ureilyticum TaxID=1590614 RepID=UPI000BAB1EE3|nr:hypothetical protein [Actibacterium ureilyticum]
MNTLNQLLNALVTRLSYPFLYTVLSLQSLIRRVRAAGKAPTIHFESAHDGRPIALVALYQKGRLRPDSRVLMQALRARGCYVLAVNTLRLDDPDDLRACCDCYVERFNFGRDFGSYKQGFQLIFQRGWDTACPRLLMINDSVFCVSDRIDGFVAQMMESEVEVLGSTENYEIIHHLGSFCIALSQAVLTHPRFRAYWQGYRNSDVRPRVILKGEQMLSKTLKACVSAPSEFQTLYGTSAFLTRLQQDDGLIDVAIRNARHSPLTGWQRFSAQEVVAALRDSYLLRGTDLPQNTTIRLDQPELSDRIAAGDMAGITRVVRANMRKGESFDPAILRKEVIAQLTEVYMSGSQIHQNAATLLQMGLPIVKLDGLYRGMFAIQDVQAITQQIPPDDAEALQRILLERPYGGDTLRGWRRAAFMRGLI